jgi:hypothetical protein
MKKKKSLVGWTHKDWKICFKFNQNNVLDSFNAIYKEYLGWKDGVKVRITIEEIK